MSNPTAFDLFRYQIIPIAPIFQLRLIDSDQDAIEKKNEHFAEALKNAKFQSAGKPLIKDLSIPLSDFYILKLGKKKNVKIFKENFSHEHVTSHPPTLIFIDNNPRRQIIAVEKNTIFSCTSIVANLILNYVNSFLKNINLRTEILPIFEEKSFWNFIEEYERDIKQIEFILVTPNMSNISKILSEDIKKTAQLSKASKTRIKLLSEKDGILEINKDNSGVVSLVDYASEGGGRVIIKGINAKYDSQNNQKTVTIESIEADNLEAIRLIREIIHGKIDQNSNNKLS